MDDLLLGYLADAPALAILGYLVLRVERRVKDLSRWMSLLTALVARERGSDELRAELDAILEAEARRARPSGNGADAPIHG